MELEELVLVLNCLVSSVSSPGALTCGHFQWPLGMGCHWKVAWGPLSVLMSTHTAFRGVFYLHLLLPCLSPWAMTSGGQEGVL